MPVSLKPVRGDRVVVWIDGAPQIGQVGRVVKDTAEVAIGSGTVKRPLDELAFVNLPTDPAGPFDDTPPDAADYLDAPSPRYHNT